MSIVQTNLRLNIDTSKLRELSDKLQKSIGKRAIRAAIKLVLQDVKGRVSVRSGALKKNIKSKVDSPKGSTAVYGVVGAKRGVTVPWRGRLLRPAKYAHLLERGPHARPYLAPAWAAGRERYLVVIQEVLAREINAILST